MRTRRSAPAWRRIGAACCLTAMLLVLLTAGTTGPAAGRAAPPPAAQLLVASREGRIVEWTVRSPSVPGLQPVRILLPRAYDSEPDARWPVLYLLHGCCDTFGAWTRSTDVVQFTEDAGVIVVMPDGGPIGFYSNWRSGPAWETYHTDELPRLIAAKLRVDGRAAIAGLSMGGRGALDYAARHPGRYVAAASFSGMVDSSLSDYEPTVYLNLLLSMDVAHPDALWGDPSRDAATWRAHDPYSLASRLRGVALFVSCGTGRYGPFDTALGAYDHDPTEETLLDENTALVARLRALHIPVHAEVGYAGTHTWPYWQREFHHAWPMLAAALHVTTDAR